MPRRAMAWRGSAVRSSPRKRIVPLRLRTMPRMARKVVVLPAPLRPISESVSPSRRSKEMPCSTWLSPYQALRSSISRRAPSMGMLGSHIGGAHPLIGRNLGIASLGQDLAALQDGDAVAKIGHHREIVLDHHHGAPLRHLAHEIDDAWQFLPADASHGLVEEQHLGIERERGRDLERALSPIGEFARGRVLKFGEVHVGNELGGPLIEYAEALVGEPELMCEAILALQRRTQ